MIVHAIILLVITTLIGWAGTINAFEFFKYRLRQRQVTDEDAEKSEALNRRLLEELASTLRAKEEMMARATELVDQMAKATAQTADLRLLHVRSAESLERTTRTLKSYRKWAKRKAEEKSKRNNPTSSAS